MAVTFWSNNDRGYRIRLLIEEGNTYTSSNESDVRYWLTLHSEGTYFSGYNISAVVIADGQSLNYSGQTSIGPNSVITLIDRTIRTKHNPGGDKYVTSTAQLTGSGGFSPGTLTVANVGLQLTTLQTAANISSTNTYLGQPLTITLDSYNSSYKYNIRYNWQGNTGTVATSLTSGTIQYTPPIEFANNIPNAKLHAITFYCDTYSGSTLIGTTQSVSTLTVPDSAKPTIGGLTLEETATVMNGISTSTEFAQILSRVKATVTGAAGVYGSTIKSYSITVVGQNLTLTENGGVFDYFKNNGTFIVRATVTDSRGMTSANKDVTINVREYFSPVGGFSVSRSGTNKDKLTVTRNAKVAPLNIGGVNKNKLSIQFKFSQRGSGVWTNSTGNANENLTSTFELINSQASLVETFSTTKSYDLIMVISDKFLSSEVKVSVGTVTIPYAVTKNAIGVGKVPEITNSVDSAYQYYYNGNPIQHLQFTENDGRAIKLTDGADLDSVTKPGFYNGLNLLHAPASGWNYIRVTKHDVSSSCVLQEAINFNGSVSAFRVKNAGTWSDWKYYAVQNNAVNFTTVNQTKMYSKTIAMPFSSQATVTRVGNQVQFTWNRAVANFSSDYEYFQMTETVPSGYRPVYEAHMPLSGNVANSVGGHAVIHLGTDGAVRMTVSAQGNRVWSGTITYLTSDPFPT